MATATSPVPASQKALSEALALAEELLRNLELGEIALGRIALKTGRLARLLNDFETEQIMAYEISGYPKTPTGIPPDAWKIGGAAGRHYIGQDAAKASVELMYSESIEELGAKIESARAALAVSSDPDISYASANPNQLFFHNQGNATQRSALRAEIETATRRLSQRTGFIHRYVSRRYYELKFSGVAQDVFATLRERVDGTFGKVIPDAVKRLAAASENLTSDNPEDWANAAHSCRRVLMDLADAVFPPTEDREISDGGKSRRIRLDKEAYVNRIVTFVTERSKSERFQEIVGSHLQYLGNRLDSINTAAQKGSHRDVTKTEAERCLIYTYMLVADILSLMDSPTTLVPEPLVESH